MIPEANKIIAEYMNKEQEKCATCGYDGLYGTEFNPYADYRGNVPCYGYCSLDALIPVWKKLVPQGGVFNFNFIDVLKAKGSLQESACLATALAIKELEEAVTSLDTSL